jgi:hypothetical protein
VLFKIDFEKAFDKIKWPFLLQVLEMKGFPSHFNDLVMQIVSGGKVGIKVNWETSPYFNTQQGLRQGYPLSSLLFDLAGDVLAILVNRVADNELLRVYLITWWRRECRFCNTQMILSCFSKTI